MKYFKKLFAVFLFVVALIAVMTIILFKDFSNISQTLRSIDVSMSSKTPNNQEDKSALKYQTIDNYGYSFFAVKNTQKISLIPNFEDKKSSSTIFHSNKCMSLINSGFYDEQANPLGLFVASGKQLSPVNDSLLFNGYVYQAGNIRSIDFDPPSTDKAEWAVQSGPILMWDGNSLNLKIKNDLGARRMISAVNNKGNLIFLAIFGSGQKNTGPLLAELPNVVKKIDIQENLNIVAAINLDGGTASAFISDELKLQELTPIGSAFCVR